MKSLFSTITGVSPLLQKTIRRFATQVEKPTLNDVVKLKNLYNTQGTTKYIEMNNLTLSFSFNDTVNTWKSRLIKENPTITSIDILSNQTYFQYAESSEIKEIINQDFIVRINNSYNYAVLAHVDDPILAETSFSYGMPEAPIYGMTSELNIREKNRIILGKYIFKMVNELQKLKSDKVDQQFLRLLNRKVLMSHSIQSKRAIADIEEKLNLLSTKSEKYNREHQEVQQLLERKSKRRVQNIYLFLYFQILFTQYGSYQLFSWDIMEPITCLFGILDVWVAYTFWLNTNQDFSYRSVVKSFVDSRMHQYLKKEQVSLDKKEEVEQMINYLNFKKLQYSSDLSDVLQALQYTGQYDEDAEQKKLIQQQLEEKQDDQRLAEKIIHLKNTKLFF